MKFEGKWRAQFVFLFIPIAVTFWGCNHASPQPSPDPLLPPRTQQIAALERLSETGDLLLRNGRDFTSRLCRNASQTDKSFSHCGIVSRENDSVFVYHITGGEINPRQTVRRDPIDLFCDPGQNDSIGLYRYAFSPAQRKQFMEQIQAFHRQKIMFDLQFDLVNDDRMYCSELVYKAWRRVMPPTQEMPLSVWEQRKYVAIDNLYLHPYAREVKRIGLKK